jgi:translation initiation factor 4A
MTSFDEMEIPPDILRGVYSYGFEKPSLIQSKAIPEIIKKKDIIAQAQSGTGKTGAYTIGSLCNIDTSLKCTQILVILPTHELVNQVMDIYVEFGKFLDINVIKLIGGTNLSDNFYDLEKNPEIIIGTPGRILDMINRNKLITEGLKMLIFDEADEILSSGFEENIYNIVTTIPKTTQIGLFSATLPDNILTITTKFMNDPVKILVKNEELTLEGIQQYYISVNDNRWKYDIIKDIYDVININQCIIYVNTKKRILELYRQFLDDQFPISYITSDLTSDQRKERMNDFKSGKIRILLSTDLLARGIDVQQLSLVINYDIPREKETYIHRIGRSGRYGRKGIAINLINEKEIDDLKFIESHYDTKINIFPENFSELFK